MADDHAVGSRRRPATPQRLTIDSHRLLAARRKAIIDALVTDPDRGRLLFANASLAFKDAGVNLSPEIADHVLHTVRQSAAATTRRERLTAQLKKALGVVPHPSDPSWLATTLFRTLELTPLATKGHDAVYQPPIPTDIEDRLRGHLPPASRPRLPARGTTTPRKIPWRLNLAADVPELPAARRAPTKVSLDELWFYLGAHQLVRPLLELGILEVSVLPTLTRAQYEAVKAGGPTGGFLDWVDSVTFPEERVRPARAGSTAKTAAKKAAPAETAPAKGAAAAETAAKKAAPVKKAAPAKTAAKKAAPTRTAATKTTTADKTAATRRTAPVAKAVKKTGARPARPR